MGRPNAYQLAMRDPARAAALGIFAGPDSDFGTDYGAEFGAAEFGTDYGYDPNVNGDYGAEFGTDYGIDIGADFGAAAKAGAAAGVAAAARQKGMHPAQAAQLLHNHQRMMQRSTKRNLLLEPNKHSDIKVERYTFSANQNVVLGTPIALSMSNAPDTTIRPQRVTTNAPSYGFANITEVKAANVSAIVGGFLDAFQFNANAVGQTLDLPTLSPANRVTVLGTYTGLVPPGFVGGATYGFVISFNGPSSITA